MKNKATEIRLSESARLVLIDNFLSPLEEQQLFASCEKEFTWEQSEIAMFGKRVPIPRLNAWFGDYAYSYSGKTFAPKVLPPALMNVMVRIENEFSLDLNSVLANLYRDGSDCMGWHSDDEASLGVDPQIASVSLGGSRRFVIRNRQDKSDKHEVLLTGGSVVLMLGTFQHHWQHCVPKTKKTASKRINLTFRLIYPTAKPGKSTPAKRSEV